MEEFSNRRSFLTGGVLSRRTFLSEKFNKENCCMENFFTEKFCTENFFTCFQISAHHLVSDNLVM